MTWAPKGFRGQARHAPAFAKDGTTYCAPPFALCTGREGRIESILPERVDCKRCLKKLASVPTDKAERRAWMQEHGVNHDGSR